MEGRWLRFRAEIAFGSPLDAPGQRSANKESRERYGQADAKSHPPHFTNHVAKAPSAQPAIVQAVTRSAGRHPHRRVQIVESASRRCKQSPTIGFYTLAPCPAPTDAELAHVDDDRAVRLFAQDIGVLNPVFSPRRDLQSRRMSDRRCSSCRRGARSARNPTCADRVDRGLRLHRLPESARQVSPLFALG